jgi:hypothetical protein
MKHPVILIALILTAASLRADDITTIRGEKFTNVSISRVEPDGIVVRKSDGIVKIPFSDLSPELRAKYGYDPEKAAQYNAAAQAAVAELQQQMEQTSRDGKVMETVEKSAMEIRAKILQVTADGVLATYYAKDASGWIPKEMSDTILIVGLPRIYSDGDTWQGTVYIAGTHQYITTTGATKTIRRWATSKQKAFELCKEWAGGKRSE